MAHEEKTIEAWLATRRSGELERLRKLEEQAADAWWESLSLRQREVLSELMETHTGLEHLRQRIFAARYEARRRRD
jgi:hypothetical protein